MRHPQNQGRILHENTGRTVGFFEIAGSYHFIKSQSEFIYFIVVVN